MLSSHRELQIHIPLCKRDRKLGIPCARREPARQLSGEMQDALDACSAEADSGKIVAGSKSAFSIPNVCFGATTMSLEGRKRPQGHGNKRGLESSDKAPA